MAMMVCTAYAQQPLISSIERVSDFTQANVLISGSGFGSNAASIQVWFGQARGSVVNVSDNMIEVTVPPQARLHNVEVINLSSRLSAKSALKYMPSFSGEGFNAAKLAAPLSFSSVNAVFDLCTCDLTGDNKPEVIGTKFENSSTDLIVLHNQSGVGSLAFISYDKFTLPALNVNAPTGHVACGDLNGDGKPEIVASRSGATANGVFILPNISVAAPAFAPHIELVLDAGHFARQLAIRDLNEDGKPEIIVTNSFNNVLYVFLNQSTAGVINIAPTPVKVILSGIPNTLALEVEDMDGDRRPDLVMTQNQGSGLYIARNISSNSIAFDPPTIIPIPGSFNDLSSADFNSDGLLDLAVTSVFNAQALVLINRSTVAQFSFALPVTLATGTGPFGTDVSDVNGDGYPDLLVPTRGVAGIDVFLHNQNLTSPGFVKVTIPTARTNWFVRAGDLDGDAKPDIAFTTFTSPTAFAIEILRNRNCYQPLILNDATITLCAGQDATLEAVPAPGASFDWKRDGTSFQTGALHTADVASAGAYTVVATTEGGACVLTSPGVIISTNSDTPPGQPAVTAAATVCEGQTLTLSTAVVPGATYHWSGPNGFSLSDSDATLDIPNVTASWSGTYVLRLQTGNCQSDPGNATIQVVALNSISVARSATGALCQGQSVTLSTSTVSGYAYQWQRGGSDLAGATSSTLVVTQDGVYRVRASYSGCSVESQDEIVLVLAPPVANFAIAATACVGEVIAFENTGSADARGTLALSWNFDDGATATGNAAAHNYTVADLYQPSLTAGYAGVTGCSSTRSSDISIAAAVLPEIIADIAQLCADQTATLSLQTSYPTIDWSNGMAGVTTTVTGPGTYGVTTVDANGCTASAEIILPPGDECGGPEITIPNMFSPNGDMRNDRWVIIGLDTYPNCSLHVFDDKGVSVFKQDFYPLEGWDGNFNGRSLPDGVYYYLLSIPDRKPMTGSVTIIR